MEGRQTQLRKLVCLLGPALTLVLILFGGGLTLGLFQALGYSPTEGLQSITFDHFRTIFTDPDFGGRITLTLYISLTSTLLAASSIWLESAESSIAIRISFYLFDGRRESHNDIYGNVVNFKELLGEK